MSGPKQVRYKKVLTFHIKPLAVPVHALDVEGLAFIATLVLILHVDKVEQSTIHAYLIVRRQICIQLPPADVWKRAKKHTSTPNRDTMACLLFLQDFQSSRKF